ncbi:MAG: 1-deoxy-D-xylulose-5-phosphate reductoisomerase, partial [Acidimicrobiales bacterium]
AGFACLSLAFAAGRAGGTAPAWMSGANEVAVEAFLDGRLGWLEIAEVVDEALQAHDGASPKELADILAADAQGRAQAVAAIKSRLAA